MSEPTGARRYGTGGGDAYYDAVKYGGYEGTREQFGKDQAEFATNATAVAAAKEVVEQDTEEVRSTKETFVNTTVPEAITAIQQEGTTQVQAVTQQGEESSQQVEAVGTQWKDEVANEGRARVQAVEQAGTTQVQSVNDAGTAQVGAVNQAGTDQIAAVEQAGTTQVQAVTDEGTTQVTAVEDAGAAERTAIEEKGEQTRESIPDDYTALSDEVDNLNRHLNDETTGLDTKAPVILETASGAIASFDDGADGMPIKKLVAQIEPVQDLHGYDSPWPAGGGNNKLAPTPQETKTQGGLTCVSDGNGVFTFSGTYSSSFNQTFSNLPVEYTVQSGDYLHCFNSNASSSAQIILNFENRYITVSMSTVNQSQSLENYVGETVKSVRFYIAAAFSGTVSPMISHSSSASKFAPYSNICPISGWTGAEIEQAGKNLCKLPVVAQSIVSNVLNNCFFIKKGQYTVTFSNPVNCTSFRACIYLKDSLGNNLLEASDCPSYGNVQNTGAYWRSGSDNTFPYTLSINIVNDCYIRFTLVLGDVGNSSSCDCMLNTGSTASTYEPYTGNQISVNWETEAGTVYGGEDEVISGKLKKTMAMVDLGELSWEYAADANRFLSEILPSAKRPESGSEKANILCSEYPVYPVNTVITMDKAIGMGAVGNITVKDSAFGTDAAAFKSAMSGVQLVYELAEPVGYDLAPQTMTTLYGTNNIWANTGDVTVTAPKDTKLYIDNKITQAIANALNS